MQGRATAPAAGTVLNALATGTGSAFAIDRSVSAAVTLDPAAGAVRGTVEGVPEADTQLIERCVGLVTDRYGDGEGGSVRTESEVPLAGGLKSSSAAANATVLATLDALGHDPIEAETPIDRTESARLGVEAARDVGVTVTGAFDDASASMLGGLTVTDNTEDRLLLRDEVEWEVVVWTPPERAFSAEADVAACERVAPLARTVAELALGGRYADAMNVNGLAFCAALDFPTDPMLEAYPFADGTSLSGTGPSYVAVGATPDIDTVAECWRQRTGETWRTQTQSTGATIP